MYPKVLLLCSLSQSTANGITVGHLFKYWPKDRIAVAEFNDSIEDIYLPNIQRYYIIGAKESRFVWPFGYLRKMRSSTEHVLDVPPEPLQKPGGAVKRGSKGWKGKLVTAQAQFLHRTGLAMVSRKFTLSKSFEQWIRDFSPDMIYCTGGDICKLDYVVSLSRQLGIPFAIHIFDDFLASKHEMTVFPRYWKKRLDSTFRKVCEKAALHLAIGDKMAEEYTQRYGHKFYGFHNPIDPSIWLAERGQIDDGESEQSAVMANGEEIIAKYNDSPSAISDLSAVASVKEDPPSNDLVVPPSAIRHPPSNAKAFAFLYAGKINKDTVGPIRRFMQAVECLNGQGQRISFKIHSPYPFEEIKRMLGEGAEKVYGGKLPYADLPAAYRAADGLLLPLDFTEATIRYIRLSMLTKVSEYMISGTPIFCFAPKEVAATEYLIEHDAGVHCGDPEQVEQAILDFIRDGESRCRVAVNAVERARQYHLMGQVNERFRGLLEVAANC